MPMNSVTKHWIAACQQRLLAMLQYLDSTWPQRIAGFHLTGMHTGEWFYPGIGDAGWQHWFADYNDDVAQWYCNTTTKQSAADPQQKCSIPTASQRASANWGNSFVVGAQTGTENNFNLFLSQHVVRSAISALAKTCKTVSQNKMFVMFFYGYLFALADARLSGSGHLALQEVINDVNVDAIVSPYLYIHFSRNVSKTAAAFLPHGPLDAPVVRKKIWIVEDDTRTIFASHTPLSCCKTLRQSVGTLVSHVITAFLHSDGLYFFDLGQAGWFGQPSHPRETALLWGNVTATLKGLQRLKLHPTKTQMPNTEVIPNVVPQIAVFVHQLSPAWTPINGSAGGKPVFDDEAYKEALGGITSLGSPVRQYLLDDLLIMDEALLKDIAFVYILNAYYVPTALKTAIRQKLYGSGRTILYQYTANIISTSATHSRANPAGLANILGIPPSSLVQATPSVRRSLLTLTTGAPSDCTTAMPTNIRFGFAGEDIGPWWHYKPPTAESPLSPKTFVLGHYTEASNTTAPTLLASFICNSFANYRTVWMGSINPPNSVLLGLAKAANVHQYTSTVLGDIIDGQGNVLMLRAGAEKDNREKSSERTVTLPFNAEVVELQTNKTVCSSCSAFTTPPMQVGDTIAWLLGTPR
eukprot:TRINITY_DN67918_c1_g1_i1.p1 TRINITY_DN67918_c1_g1~~TRINITY_DN67918_c1_g1_i1.p1  ORF type:complete len:665 (+),score=30.96 TRINITY_DN67918_c1_g1_i1:84-1997(+)